MGDLIYGNNV